MSEETIKKSTEKNLEKLTVKELRALAAELPHERAILDMKKTELIAFIKEARGIKDGAPVKAKKHVVKIKMTKAELKAKIRELKTLKIGALEAEEKKKAIALRHQLNQLKKKSRRVVAVA